jgi:site-specific DNA-methyltransferase (adenine-specific)
MLDGNQTNLLYYGDNLDILRRYVKDETVDLVYLDPPFNSNQNYSVLFAEKDGSKSAAQIHAFEDTWQWDESAARAYQDLVETGGKVSQAMQAFRAFLGPNDMLAYLAMMAPRLVELRRVLKPTGSIYLHCDPTASHYLKMLMDAVFGPCCFRNEIHWYYYNKMHDSRKKLFPRATDTLFFYVKDVDADFTFTQLKEMRDQPVKQLARVKVGGRMVNRKDEHGHVVYRIKEDRTIDNVWRIPCLQPAAPERLGYQTQKPEALVRRLIEASSNAGDLVLDPFSGCGTAVVAAERLGRRWIGIDITHLAITLMKKRLYDTFGKDAQFQVIGEPTDVAGAEALARQDPYQFQWWALGLVDARPAEGKKGADKGIDGRIYFHDEQDRSETKQVILSVKAGHTNVAHVRDLRGVIEREGAEIGVLITMEEPTQPMRTEAADAGFYHSPGWNIDCPRIQLRTIAELLAGKGLDVPPQQATFKEAPKHVSNGYLQLELPAPATSDADAVMVSDKPASRHGSPRRKPKA